MYTQNILKSDNRRLCKRVILDQKENEEEDSFYGTAKQQLEKYDIDIDLIADMQKSELKKLVKDRINRKMEKMFEETAKRMKKLRFITDFRCQRKEYMAQMDGFECLQTIKTRLNMLPVYANYRADVRYRPLKCRSNFRKAFLYPKSTKKPNECFYIIFRC